MSLSSRCDTPCAHGIAQGLRVQLASGNAAPQRGQIRKVSDRHLSRLTVFRPSFTVGVGIIFQRRRQGTISAAVALSLFRPAGAELLQRPRPRDLFAASPPSLQHRSSSPDLSAISSLCSRCLPHGWCDFRSRQAQVARQQNQVAALPSLSTPLCKTCKSSCPQLSSSVLGNAVATPILTLVHRNICNATFEPTPKRSLSSAIYAERISPEVTFWFAMSASSILAKKKNTRAGKAIIAISQIHKPIMRRKSQDQALMPVSSRPQSISEVAQIIWICLQCKLITRRSHRPQQPTKAVL